jgi:hypothetical protein
MNDVVLKLKPSERRDLIAELHAFANASQAETGLLAQRAADEIENLAERLEVAYVWQTVPGGTELERVDAPDEVANWDGIACRDVTIKMLEGSE